MPYQKLAGKLDVGKNKNPISAAWMAELDKKVKEFGGAGAGMVRHCALSL
jgi:hypothetical protein